MLLLLLLHVVVVVVVVVVLLYADCVATRESRRSISLAGTTRVIELKFGHGK